MHPFVPFFDHYAQNNIAYPITFGYEIAGSYCVYSEKRTGRALGFAGWVVTVVSDGLYYAGWALDLSEERTVFAWEEVVAEIGGVHQLAVLAFEVAIRPDYQLIFMVERVHAEHHKILHFQFINRLNSLSISRQLITFRVNGGYDIALFQVLHRHLLPAGHQNRHSFSDPIETIIVLKDEGNLSPTLNIFIVEGVLVVQLLPHINKFLVMDVDEIVLLNLFLEGSDVVGGIYNELDNVTTGQTYFEVVSTLLF